MKITLLISTFNRANQLNNTLQRLCLITQPDEVLIVDDGSSDNTKQIVDNFVNKLPIRYIYNHNPQHSICSMARNIGVKQSIGDIIITSEPELLWITDIIPQMLKARDAHPREIISIGTIYHAQVNAPWHPQLVVDPKAMLKDSIVENYEIRPRSYRQDGYVKTVNMQATFGCLYEKQWLMDVGGWDESFKGAWGWDDVDLCTRLRINGVNQYIDWDQEAVHQWHPHLPPHLQGEASLINEEYMKSKQLNIVEQEILEKKQLGTYTKIDERLIANRKGLWGEIIPRGN